ncbi:hypothetical protein JYB64_11650 [Algoriphagus aestuarii]|nr:hypothetical protein [Algoriphagus aestuarii]
MSNKILILSYSEIHSDPRVLRQIALLESLGFELVLSGLDYLGDHVFYPLTKSKSNLSRAVKLGTMVGRVNRLRVKEFLYNSSLKELEKLKPKFGLIIANDAETWPVAIALKKKHPKARIIFDAHEFYPGQFTDDLKWIWFHKRFSKFLCKNYIPKADLLITVCEGLAEAYTAFTSREIPVVLNAPKYSSDLKPSPVGRKIRLIHHGIANRSRQIEKMIELMDYLDARFELNFMLMPTDKQYFEELILLSEGKPIHFLDPVDTEAIPSFINQFDIGLFYLEPVNFNYTFALPNKFFEFIQARLAIAIAPSIEMKKILNREDIGVVSEEFDLSQLASRLNSLTNEDIIRFKENANRIAKKYSADQHDEFYRSQIKKWNLQPGIK